MRNYAKEYANYHSKPEQKINRAKRNAARAMMKKELGAAAIRGKDIDHKKPLKSGGTNARSNLRVMSKSQNRAKK
jgi:5-methylcytosine-specific restriction endonuclease McrA